MTLHRPNLHRPMVLSGAIVIASFLVVVQFLPAPDNDTGFAQSNSASLLGWSVDAHEWERSVVRVRSERCEDVIEGTGVIIDGAVVTNGHVIDGARRVAVTTHDGQTFSVTEIERSRDLDVARLRIAHDVIGSSLVLQPVTVRQIIDIAGGPADRVPTLAGFPAASDLVIRRVTGVGLTSGKPPVDPSEIARLDVEVIGGESGSPLMSADGTVLGILYGRSTADGSGLAISGSDLSTALDQVRKVPPVRCDD